MAVSILFFSVTNAYAVNPQINFHHYVQQHYGLEQGVPQVSILDIEQDEAGYIWFGTQSGLVRFDGHSFKVYGTEKNSVFPSVMVSRLLYDQAHRLWVVTAQGLIYRQDNQFFPYAFDFQRYGYINQITMLEDGTVLVAANGIYELTKQGPKPFLGIHYTVHSVLVSDEKVWIGGVGSITEFNRKTSREKQFALPDLQNKVTDIVMSAGKLWLGTNKGLYTLEDSVLKSQHHRLPTTDPTITALYLDVENMLWVGTKDMIFRLGTNTTEHIGKLNPNFVSWPVSFFEDHEGNFWVGSRTDGLYKFWNGWARKYSEFEGVEHGFVWSVAANNEALWLGSNSGLTSYDGREFKVRVTAEQLSDSEVYTLLAESEHILLGTKQGLAVFKDDTVTYPNVFSQLKETQITVLHRDRFDDLWIGTVNGLYLLRDGVLVSFSQNQGIDSDDIRAVFDSTKYGLFVGAMRGLYIKVGERFVVTGPEVLRNAFITSINQTKSGLMVVGTYTKGLFIFDGQNWTNITRDTGLYSNSVFSQVEVDGFWWLSSHEGLSRVPTEQIAAFHRGAILSVEKETILSLNNAHQDAQQIRCCNGAGTAKSSFFQGALWYPTLDGVVKVEPDHIVFNSHKPNVVIEQVTFGEDAYLTHDNFELSDKTSRNVTIFFTALSYQKPENVKFRYRLKGQDSEWQEGKNVRQVSYKSLAPGSYTFEVLASNNHGVWSDRAESYSFYLPPTFKESIWFKLLISSFILITIVGLFAIMQVSNKRRQRFLEKVIAERTKEVEEANYQLQQKNEKLQQISQTDILTNLKNRYYFEEQIERDIAYFQRHVKSPEGRVMAFVLIDIDHFKSINDSFGHKSGDQVLQQFAKILNDFTRYEDYAVRMGGEEFLIVVRDIDAQKIDFFVQRLLKAIESGKYIAGNSPIKVTASIGYSTYPIRLASKVDSEWSILLQLADYALYQSKAAGRNASARVIATTSDIQVHGIYDLKTEIEQLVEKGDLEIQGSWQVRTHDATS